MVSLLNNNTPRTRGFHGFSDDRITINSAQSDDDLIVDHIDLVSGPEVSHRPMTTVWAIVMAKLLYVALVVAAYVVPHECNEKTAIQKCGVDSVSLTLIIHGGIWFVLFGLDRYFHMKHEASRLSGYLDFYRKTRNIRRMPIFINSCGNAVMLIVVKLLDNYCEDNCYRLRNIEYIQILVSIECVVAIIFLLVYLVYTVMFNQMKALPDVSQEEVLTSFGTLHANADLGFRNEGYDEQVMEKQADMIRYLKQHTETLARRNLMLTEEIFRLKRDRSHL